MYIIRIELHREQNYEPLHSAMSRRGFTRTIRCSDGVTYDLPTGTYYSGANSNTVTVMAAVEAAAAETGHRNAMIVVSEASANRIANLPVTPAWRKGA